MNYQLGDNNYNVIIEKKDNKNTYIRVKEDLSILVTTNYFVSKRQIRELLDSNYKYLSKTIEKRKKQIEKQNQIYLFGKKYSLVYSNAFNNVEIIDDKIYARDEKQYRLWYNRELKNVFEKRYEYQFNLFDESVFCPKLRIRKMKTRWGVCNKKSKTITLNSKLIEYDISALDYVIIHEFSHLVHFNHSSSFWSLVKKYVPNYKQIRNSLKE